MDLCHIHNMKAVILAGGVGSRLSEETGIRPKPMVEIGGKPILWHIMKIFSAHGVTDFVICLGYKGYLIKEYFSNYFMHMSDVTFDMKNNTREIHSNTSEPWRVTLVDTGNDTMTGGRIKRVSRYLNPTEDFFMTYGDGVSDIDITALLKHHQTHKLKSTITVTKPPGRFGIASLKDHRVDHFEEKPAGDGGYINGGFMVLSPKVLEYISDDSTIWEQDPMRRLASESQMTAYRHEGFWHPMDTLRDKNYLEDLWQSGRAPWKKW